MNYAHEFDKVKGERLFSSMLNGAELANKSTGFFLIAETYVNSLRQIHSYIVEAKLKENAKNRYVSILKSYISVNEIEFIVYYINFLKSKNMDKELMPLYNDFKVSEYFAYNFQQRWNLKLIYDGGTL